MNCSCNASFILTGPTGSKSNLYSMYNGYVNKEITFLMCSEGHWKIQAVSIEQHAPSNYVYWQNMSGTTLSGLSGIGLLYGATSSFTLPQGINLNVGLTGTLQQQQSIQGGHKLPGIFGGLFGGSK